MQEDYHLPRIKQCEGISGGFIPGSGESIGSHLLGQSGVIGHVQSGTALNVYFGKSQLVQQWQYQSWKEIVKEPKVPHGTAGAYV